MSNTINITGNAGADAELSFSQSGTAMLKFGLADSERKKHPNGEWETVGTTWFNVTAFGPLAELFGEAIKRGSLVKVAGRVKLREFDKRDGSKGWSLDVVADSLGVDKPRGSSSGQRRQQPAAEDPWAQGGTSFTDEPPF